MGWRIVKQPNGRLARFSDVVDDFTHYDMTEAEALEVCREAVGRADAPAKVRRGVEDEPMPPFVEASGKGDGLDRYRDALATVRAIHGGAAAKKWARLLSADPAD